MPDETNKIQKSALSQKYSFLFWEMIFAFIIFFLGIFTSWNFYLFVKQNQVTIPQISTIGFLGYFLGGTILILLASFFLKKKNIKKNFYKTLFVIGNVYGVLSVLPGVLSLFLPVVGANILCLLIAIIVFWMWFKKPTVWNNNFLMILGMAGIGGLMGLEFTPRIVAIILAILSLYDFIAVYKTKHMVKMAESMVESETILGLIIPSRLKDFSNSMSGQDIRKKFVIIGGGDLVFPLIMAASFIPQGLFKVSIVAAMALIGIAISFLIFLSQKQKEAIPALPAIALFSLLGCLIAISF